MFKWMRHSKDYDTPSMTFNEFRLKVQWMFCTECGHEIIYHNRLKVAIQSTLVVGLLLRTNLPIVGTIGNPLPVDGCALASCQCSVTFLAAGLKCLNLPLYYSFREEEAKDS